MEFIKNYKDWVDENKLIEFLDSYTGNEISVTVDHIWDQHPTLAAQKERVQSIYKDKSCKFQYFTQNDEDGKNLGLALPKIPDNDNNTKFWFFIKLGVGQMEPMHYDPAFPADQNLIKYTMYLNDWEPGHIFIYDDKIMTNYKAGDLYRWSDPDAYHGISNISYTPRYTLIITTFNDETQNLN